jgi:hypothetical protein
MADNIKRTRASLARIGREFRASVCSVDGFVANPGVGGSTFASDDDGTWQWPLVKIAWGANGAFNYAGVAAPVPTQASIESNQMTAGGTVVTPKYAIIDAATSGDNTLVAAVTAKKVRVLAAFLVAAGTVNVRFESGAGGTALTGQMNLVANTGFALPYNPAGWFETASNTLLNCELSAAISVDGCLTYIEV